MDDYAGRVLADRYRLPLPPSDEYELTETRAFDTYSGQEVLVRQVPLPEVVEAEVLGEDGLPDGFTARDRGARRPAAARTATRRPSDPAVRRAVEAAQAAARIPDHPRLDQVFDVFAEGGSLWIVSELVSAQTLATLLVEKPLSPYRAAEVAADVLMALRVLHAHGWVHRNITARTVLVCDDGRVMLTGLAVGAAEEALCGYDPVPVQDGEDGGPPRGQHGGGAAVPAVSAARAGSVTHGGSTAPAVPGDSRTGGGAIGFGGAGGGPGAGAAAAAVSPVEADPEAARRAAIEARAARGLPGVGAEGGGGGGSSAALARREADGVGDIRAARAGAIAAYRAGARAAARVQEAQQTGRPALPGARPAPAGEHGTSSQPGGAAPLPYSAGNGVEHPSGTTPPGQIADPYGVRNTAWHGAAPRPGTGGTAPAAQGDRAFPPPTGGPGTPSPGGTGTFPGPDASGPLGGDTSGHRAGAGAGAGAPAQGGDASGYRAGAPGYGGDASAYAGDDQAHGGDTSGYRTGAPTHGAEASGYRAGTSAYVGDDGAGPSGYRADVPAPFGGDTSGHRTGAPVQGGDTSGYRAGDSTYGRDASAYARDNAPNRGTDASGYRAGAPAHGTNTPPHGADPTRYSALTAAGQPGVAAPGNPRLPGLDGPVPPAPGAGNSPQPPSRWDELAAAGAPARRGPATALAAERARQVRMTVVGPVTERWAPEQAVPVHENWQLAAPIGPATDLWALGALLFRAVQGHAPYPEESTAELVQLVCAEPPAFAEECGPLRPVVESLLRQDPTERLDFEELRGWLRSLVRSAPEPEAGTHVVATPPTDPRRLPIVRRRGELVRRRRAGLPATSPHGRHKRAKEEVVGSPRRLGRTLLILIFLLLAGAVAYAMLFLPKSGENSGAGQGDKTGTAGDASPAPSQSSAEASSQPQPDQTSPAASNSPSTSASSSPTQTDPNVAAGFVLRKDSVGFQVAVAKGWTRTPKNGSGQVVYSHGDFELIVVAGRDSATKYGSDPMVYQRDSESELQPYRNSSWATATGLRTITVGGKTMAEGQFTWTDSQGGDLFVRNMAFLIDGRYHIVQVRGPEAQRDEVTRLYEQASSTYQYTG
ncbi:protein kinase domain-containing protein [Streptomyces xylophagus]|uniref:protein kinase domain-containing protein n=1 Tax=Streptomyces xylophagus TaxID=285514 RepID=UPI0005BC5425|nr:protein kinase [Streptomyces xylophagus]